MLYKYDKRTHNFEGLFYLYFALDFFILGAFSLRQLFINIHLLVRS